MRLKHLLPFLVLNMVTMTYALSGTVTHDTTWSTDVIITGNVVVDSTATLTIAKGVNVQFVRSDTNSDGNGDITFFVYGNIRSQGTSALPVTFKSYETVPQRNDWHGLVFAGTGYCGNSIIVKNAVAGVTINSKSKNIILNRFNISSCVTGIFADTVKDSVYLYNFTIDSSKFAGAIQKSTKIRMFNIRAIHSDSGGLLINQSTVSIQNSQFDTNGIYGLKLISSLPSTSSLMATYSNFCSNKGYGLWVDSLSGLNANYCNISSNIKTGVLIKSNSLQISLINNCNINGNSILPDTIDLSSLTFRASNDNKQWYGQSFWFRFPAYFSTINLHCIKDSYGVDIAQVLDSKGNKLYYDATNINGLPHEGFPVISSSSPLSGDSIYISLSINTDFYAGSQFVNFDAVTFAKPHQLIYLTTTTSTINCQSNYWGQITGVDTIIGTQSLVNHSNYQTVIISTAGYQPSSFIQNINVTPLSYSFNNVPLNFIDSCSIIVQNTGSDILVCEGVASNNSVFPANTNNIYLFGLQKDTIKVKFTPDSVKSETGFLTIPTNVTGKEIMQVVLQGTGIPADHPPVYSSRIPDTLVIAGTTLNRTLPATDPDAGDSLTYSVVSGPTGLSYVSGLISWAIPLNAVNSTVIVKAVDRYGLTARDTFLLSINHPPQITSVVPDSNLTVGHAYTYDVNAIDQDGDSLSYFLDSLVGSMSISQISGLISFTPTVNDTGRHTISVRVTDARGASAYQKYHITVRTVLDAIQFLASHTLPKSYSLSCHRTASGLFSLRFAIPVRNQSSELASRNVSISLYDLQGRLLLRAVVGSFFPGYYSSSIKLNLANSPILLRMESEGYSSTFKLF